MMCSHSSFVAKSSTQKIRGSALRVCCFMPAVRLWFPFEFTAVLAAWLPGWLAGCLLLPACLALPAQRLLPACLLLAGWLGLAGCEGQRRTSPVQLTPY